MRIVLVPSTGRRQYALASSTTIARRTGPWRYSVPSTSKTTAFTRSARGRTSGTARPPSVEQRVDAERRDDEQRRQDRRGVATERQQHGQQDVEVEDRQQERPDHPTLAM